MQPSCDVRDPKQISAMIHPLRKQILRLLGRGPATPSEVARTLGMAASKIHYHVRILEKAGLIYLHETKQIGSVKELYFEAIAKEFMIRPASTDDDALDLVYGNFQQEMKQFIKDIKRSKEAQRREGSREGSLLCQVTVTADENGMHQIEEAITLLRDQFERAKVNFPGNDYRLVVGFVRDHDAPHENMEGDE